MKPYSFLLIISFILVAFKADAAAGDTLYHQDFNGQLPSGWQSQSNSSPNHLWIWSNTAPGGQYALNSNPLNSPTANNGFLVLPSDLYNTPTPAGGFVNVNASITSDAISINPSNSVHLSFFQSQRFCCTQSNAMYVEVSADSVNWTVFPATNYRTSEASSENGEYLKINVTSVLAGQSTAYLRFVQSGASHYYWMIDDVMLIEGPKNQLEISKMRMTSVDSFQVNPDANVQPLSIACPSIFKFLLENTGSYAITNNYCISKFYYDNGFNYSLLNTDTNYLQYQINPGQKLDVRLPLNGFNIFSGHYIYELECKSDSSFDRLVKDSLFMTFSDSLIRKNENDSFPTSFGPQHFMDGGNDRDFVGNLFTINDPGVMNSALSFYIPNDSNVIGARIVPKVYKYEEDSLTLNASLSVVAENFVYYVINSNMLGKWNYFDYVFGTGPVFLTPGQYVAGFTLIDSISHNFLIGRDLEAERNQIQAQSLVFINDSTPEWKWISQVAAVRIHISSFGGMSGCPIYVSEKEEVGINKDWNIYPNPTNGELSIDFNEQIKSNLQLVVYDLKGVKVLYQNIMPQSKNKITLNLSHLKDGLYVFQLQSDDEVWNKKVLIQH